MPDQSPQAETSVRRMWSGDLADVLTCVRCQQLNRTYRDASIGQMLVEWNGLKVGDYVLVRETSSKECTIERAMPPEEIERQALAGSLLTTILQCIGFPLAHVRIAMTADKLRSPSAPPAAGEQPASEGLELPTGPGAWERLGEVWAVRSFELRLYGRRLFFENVPSTHDTGQTTYISDMPRGHWHKLTPASDEREVEQLRSLLVSTTLVGVSRDRNFGEFLNREGRPPKTDAELFAWTIARAEAAEAQLATANARLAEVEGERDRAKAQRDTILAAANKFYKRATTAEARVRELEAELDPPVCRLQFPDGSVPGNAREAAEGWKRVADGMRGERDTWKAQHDRILSQAQRDFDRAAMADTYEQWLLDIGKLSGCGHVDERLPRCIDEAFEALQQRATTAEAELAAALEWEKGLLSVLYENRIGLAKDYDKGVGLAAYCIYCDWASKDANEHRPECVLYDKRGPLPTGYMNPSALTPSPAPSPEPQESE